MSIDDAVSATSLYLTEHPGEARYRDSAARTHLTSGLAVEVTGPGGERLTTDLPRGIGGTGAAPSPGWMIRAAAVAFPHLVMTMLAEHLSEMLLSLLP